MGSLWSANRDDEHVVFQHTPTAHSRKFASDEVHHLFDKLHSQAPCFPVHANHLSFIEEPKQFYQHLIDGIQRAQNRVVLCSLYLGIGEHEDNIVKSLDTALAEKPDLKVTILMDYLRGTRGAKRSAHEHVGLEPTSTSGMLLPLVKKYGADRLNVHFYHTPAIGPWLRKVLPERFDEVIGVQHMKIYMFDNDMILSGANLSDWYFADRQDRYVYIQQQENICSFYSKLVQTVNKFSYELKANGDLQFPEQGRDPQQNSKQFVAFANQKVKQFFENQYLQQIDRLSENNISDQQDTWIFPVIQMGQLKIRHDESVTRSLIDHAAENSSLTIGSAYFNLTSNYMHSILTSPSKNIKVLTAAPISNGFYTAKGLSRNIPSVYDYMEQVFMNNVRRSRRSDEIRVYEYLREGWTFHGKGLWYYASNDNKPSATIIGSSNFGARSTERDVESQIIILTENDNLKTEMENEHARLFKYTRQATKELLASPDRKVALWLRLLTKYFACKFL